jgi:uncharacterized protein YuzE
MDVDTLVAKMVKTITETWEAQRSIFFEISENGVIMVNAECIHEKYVPNSNYY